MTRARTWIVRAGEAGMALGDLLPQIDGDAPAALERGGVFVAGRRVYDIALRLRAGERVEVTAPRAQSGAVQILDERAGLVAVFKPAELATEPDRTGSASLISAAAAALDAPLGTLHAMGRLDVGVSGIVLLARDKAAREYARRAHERGILSKSYLGIVTGAPSDAPSGVWSGPIAGQHAETRWQVLAENSAPAARAALLLLEPVTGRTHQLRAHTAGAGVPLYGDRRYGGPTRLVSADGSVHALDRILLHASRLELEDWVVEAPLPPELVALLTRLGIEQ